MGNFVSELQQHTAFALEDKEKTLADVTRELGFQTKAGDIVLLRMNVDYHEGLPLPPSIASKMLTASLGENPALAAKVPHVLCHWFFRVRIRFFRVTRVFASRQTLPNWDRVCLMVEWGRDKHGELAPPGRMQGTRTEPCVVLAEEEELEVVPFVDVIASDRYEVIAVRHIEPPLDEHPGRTLLETLTQSAAAPEVESIRPETNPTTPTAWWPALGLGSGQNTCGSGANHFLL